MVVKARISSGLMTFPFFAGLQMKLAWLYGIGERERSHDLVGALTAPFASVATGVVLLAVAFSDLSEPAWSFPSFKPDSAMTHSASLEWTTGIIPPVDKLPASLARPVTWNAPSSSSASPWGGEPDQKVLKFPFSASGDWGPEIAQEISCLAQNIYFEARSEPHVGKLAVAHVVMNRVASKRFPGSICEVIRQGGSAQLNRCQFSWWCDGKSDKPGNLRAWRESLKLASDIYWGLVEDPTEGAMWYHADYVSPNWRTDLVEGPKFGRHIFYASKSDKPRQQLAAKQAK
jgi:hypothetical protein